MVLRFESLRARFAVPAAVLRVREDGRDSLQFVRGCARADSAAVFCVSRMGAGYGARFSRAHVQPMPAALYPSP